MRTSVFTIFTLGLAGLAWAPNVSLAKELPESPYAIFGDSSKTLGPKRTVKKGLLRCPIKLSNNTECFADFDFEKGFVVIRNRNGVTISSDSIGYTRKAMFLTIDPHADIYYNSSPYIYCSGNPVNAIDYDGRDWYRNNSTSYYTWFDGDKEREGFSHIGGTGSVLGEFEGIIDAVLCGNGGLGLESLYSNGFTFDIAPNDKRALSSSKERDDDFFSEFVFGRGPEFTVLLGDHPYTKAVMEDYFAKECQDVVRSRGNNGRYTNVGRPEFFPWQASALNPMQFIGTYRYDGYSSMDNKYINNVVFDSKSVTSLGYHIPLLNDHRRSENPRSGNTYQFYIWRSKK